MINKQKPLRILLLEDVEDDAELIEQLLRKEGWEFMSYRVDTKLDFIEALRMRLYDVILSDHSLPQFNSSEALKICRRASIQVPFILVTGTVSEEFAVKSLKQGADDYVLKTNLKRLPTSITNATKQRRIEAERRLAENTLRTQNEELIKINQELDSFVYSVSHNLRAPLMSLLGLVQISSFDSHQRDEVYDQYFNMMRSSITKLDETIKEILEYSRNARNEVTIAEIDFAAMLTDCIEKLKYLEGFDQIDIKVDIQGNHHHFYSDPHRLSVILGNLLSNAIKYGDPKKPKSWINITVCVTNHAVDFIFRDNGIGIEEALLAKIFKMFYRGTERSSGAGLGLYIVKETLQKLDGSIEVKSEVDEGSTFKLSIPNLIMDN